MRRELCLALAMLALLAGSAGVTRAQSCYEEPQGIGGTGRSGGDQGIGGTGSPARESEEQGIGGTGIFASLAPGESALIVGTITSFGSVCVNGVRVQFDESTPVRVDGVKSGAQALRVGDWVQVRASRSDSALRAREIRAESAAVGRVESVAADGRSFAVGGRVIALAPEIASAPGVGENVRVFGMPRGDDSVVASRVEPAADATASAASRESLYGDPARALAESPVVSVEGFARALPQANRIEVGGFPVDLGKESPAVASDTRVRVTGRVEARELRASRVEIESLREGRRTWIERGESGVRMERQDRAARDDRPERSDRSERGERSGHGGGDRPARPEREDRSGHGDRGEGSGHSGHGGQD